MNSQILIRIPPQEMQSSYLRNSAWSKATFFLAGLSAHRLIQGGGWHKRTIPFFEHPAYRLLKTFYREDFRAEECREALCRYYRERGRSFREAEEKTKQKLEDYVQRYHALAESMLQNGYMINSAADEIGGAITPEGKVIKVANGNHRLALAMILGLPYVVAEIRFVHRAWYRGIKPSRTESVETNIASALRQRGYELLSNP